MKITILNGKLDSEVLSRLSHPERFLLFMVPILNVFLRLSISHSYFDNMLKKNGAFEQRLARPFLIESEQK